MVNGNTFMPLLEKFPGIAAKLDTLEKPYVIRKQAGSTLTV